MTLNTTPVFVHDPKLAVGQVSAANTNRDGTGTIVTLFSAGTNGSRVNRIKVKAVGTTTAGMVRLYIHDGSNARLYAEVTVTAITPSAAVESFEETIDYQGEDAIILPTGYSIRASTHNAETFNVFVEGGDY